MLQDRTLPKMLKYTLLGRIKKTKEDGRAFINSLETKWINISNSYYYCFLQKSSWPVWFPWELYDTDVILND